MIKVELIPFVSWKDLPKDVLESMDLELPQVRQVCLPQLWLKDDLTEPLNKWIQKNIGNYDKIVIDE